MYPARSVLSFEEVLVRSYHSYEADHRLCQQSLDRIIAHGSQNTDKGYECMYGRCMSDLPGLIPPVPFRRCSGCYHKSHMQCCADQVSTCSRNFRCRAGRRCMDRNVVGLRILSAVRCNWLIGLHLRFRIQYKQRLRSLQAPRHRLPRPSCLRRS